MIAPPTLDVDGAAQAASESPAAAAAAAPAVPPVNQPLPPPPADDPLEQIRDLKHQVEELLHRLRLVEAQTQYQQTPWSQRVFLIQPDGGNTLYSESSLSYSGTNPTTVPLSDQTGTIARSFLQANLIIPPAGAAAVMQFNNGTDTAYVKLPGGLDLLQAGTNVIKATPFLNVPTNRGTSTILEFVTATVSGTPGANLQLASPASNRVVIIANGTNWEQGYVRFHS